jgi:hypothetical protein
MGYYGLISLIGLGGICLWIGTFSFFGTPYSIAGVILILVGIIGIIIEMVKSDSDRIATRIDKKLKNRICPSCLTNLDLETEICPNCGKKI